jgi:hypothetical protein
MQPDNPDIASPAHWPDTGGLEVICRTAQIHDQLLRRRDVHDQVTLCQKL